MKSESNYSTVPPAISQEFVQNATVKAEEAARLEGSCDTSTATIECSDPGVKAAIEQYNLDHFPALNFYQYRAPVRGSTDKQCDVAWKYRAKNMKTPRMYRDFRRYALKRNKDCSFSVLTIGAWHSGVSARPTRRPKIGDGERTGLPAQAAEQQTLEGGVDVVLDAVGPISAKLNRTFGEHNYLFYQRGGDYCKSMNQFMWSFLCALGEARYLSRTFVMDLELCLSAENNPGHTDEIDKDFRFYFDYEHLKEVTPIIEKNTFEQQWLDWNSKHPQHELNVHYVTDYKVAPSQLKNETSTILYRKFDDKEEANNYWYRVCEGEAEKYIERPWHFMWKSKRLMDIVTAICNKLDWDFDTLHVVRGWKVKDKELWPQLDADTSPENIVAKLEHRILQGRKIYIATNEVEPTYFDKLRGLYKVYVLDDFKDLWSVNSEWYNATMALNGGSPVPFDGYMRVEIDSEMLYKGKMKIETFNDLTKDCKNGVNRCLES